MSGRTMGIVGWAVIFGSLFAWQGVALVREHEGWLTISRMIEVAGRYPAVRWMLFAAWLWFGWHVFIRTWQFIPQR